MDFVSFLGGLALGATGAALFDAGRGSALLGQSLLEDEEEEDPVGVTAGGASGGGGGASALGPVAGPPVGSGGGGGGPHVVGPTVSVPPIVHDGGGGGGESFFGVSAPWWFWPSYAYAWPPRPVRLICRKETTEEGEEALVCERRPERPLAWGPIGWF